MAPKRKGSVLAAVIFIAVIIGILAMVLMDRTRTSSYRAAWGKEHLMLRLLVESAQEEIYAKIMKAANEPNSKIWELFRTVYASSPSGPVGIPDAEIKLTEVVKDVPVVSASLGGDVKLSWEGSLEQVTDVGPDDFECKGVLKIKVGALSGSRFFGIAEKVAVDHPFRVAYAGLHKPLEQDALWVVHKPHKKKQGEDPDGGKNGQPGQNDPEDPGDPGANGAANPPGPENPEPPDGEPEAIRPQKALPGTVGAQARGRRGGRGLKELWYSLHVQGSRTLKDIVGEDGAKLAPSMPDWTQSFVMRIMQYFPYIAKKRAHFKMFRPGQVRRFIMRQSKKGGVHGTIMYTGKDILWLRLKEPYKGEATIVSRAPVVIMGDLRAADPSKDSLTIASSRTIAVAGSKVDANLICMGGKERRGGRGRKRGGDGERGGKEGGKFGGMFKGIILPLKTRITGTVIAQRPPHGLPFLDAADESEIACPPGQQNDNRGAFPPDEDSFPHYRVVFGPGPSRVNHQLD